MEVTSSDSNKDNPLAQTLQGNVDSNSQSYGERIPNSYSSYRYSSPDSEESPSVIHLHEEYKNRNEQLYNVRSHREKYLWKSAGYTECSASCLGNLPQSFSHIIIPPLLKAFYVRLVYRIS